MSTLTVTHEEMVRLALQTISDAERDLRRVLSEGERRDLLADNHGWDTETIAKVERSARAVFKQRPSEYQVLPALVSDKGRARLIRLVHVSAKITDDLIVQELREDGLWYDAKTFNSHSNDAAYREAMVDTELRSDRLRDEAKKRRQAK